jgi:hypothetical protein
MPHEAKAPGPIEGLRLPARAWGALRREGITNLDQLMSVAIRSTSSQALGQRWHKRSEGSSCVSCPSTNSRPHLHPRGKLRERNPQIVEETLV